MRIEIQWNSLFPLSMPYVTTLQYREIFWQNGSLLYGSDTAKQEFFMRLQLRLQSLHKHDFISNQLLFYCWLTQQHLNFSVFFSFNSYPCFPIYRHTKEGWQSVYLDSDQLAEVQVSPFLDPRVSLLRHGHSNFFCETLTSWQRSKSCHS